MFQTVTLNTAQSALLGEAWRRVFIKHPFEVKSLNDRFLGLGFPSEYKPAVDAGLMRPSHGETPRVLNWYCLTELGQKIVKQAIRKHGRVSCHDTPMISPFKVKVKV
jgi:hypothetical protein